MEIDRTSPLVDKGQFLPTVLVLGDPDRAEMQFLYGWLKREIGDNADWTASPTIASHLESGFNEKFPDLIVVFQSWPLEYSIEEVHRLMASAPLARLVVCYGAWCESDGRNYSVWPQAVRVPVWRARIRIEYEWRLIRSPEQTLPIPWSASREEVFSPDHPPITTSDRPQRILIDSPDSAYVAFLAEQLISTGHSVVRESPSVLIFDSDPWGPFRKARLLELTDRYPNAPVLAVADLVQPPLVQGLDNCGVKTVLNKLGTLWPI